MGSPTPPLPRLAILECDKLQPQARDSYSSYTGLFSALFAAAGRQLDPPRPLDALLSVRGFDVVNELHTYPALDDVDAVLISGSHHSAFDDDPWIKNLVDFAKRALDSGRVRVIGVCFGHQIVGRALGVPVVQSSKGWEIAVTDVDLTDEGKAVFGLDRMRIQHMHRDVVVDFPAGAVPLGSNGFCAVQNMYSPGRYLTVQGHPEFTTEVISEVIFNRHTVGLFNDALYEDAMRRAALPHDGLAIAKAFLRFIRDE